jgi:hypothetical protein
MKMNISIIVFLAIIIAIYFHFDYKLAYYGKNDFEIYNTLPFGMHPEYWGWDVGNYGFVLEDQNGFGRVYKNKVFILENDTIIVERINAYKYNENKVIAEIESKDMKKYLVEVIPQQDKEMSPELEIIKHSNNYIDDIKELKWVKLKGNEAYINKIWLIRNYAQTLGLIIFFVLIFRLIKLYRFKNKY